jgi:cytoplasmic iron level regulating protein YaaA (DUF328/UPF0246 family)
MIVLLSPAKTLDLNPTELGTHSQPRLLADSHKLIEVLRKESVDSIKKLMKVSDNIATLNVERYQQFSTPFSLDNAKQSVLTFKGDVYQGLDAGDFDATDLEFAQKHLRILSGLYGILRPLDLMQAYRLEMGTKLKNGKFKNLYEFWDNRISQLINEDLTASGSNIIVNLASKEYFKAVKPKELNGKILHIHFKEQRGDKLKVIAFNAKKARGAMSNQIIKYKITSPEALKSLLVNDYVFTERLSDEENYVFVKE